jgi:1-phosphofructokinase/tagatose 6-phosphate kinase
MPVICLCLSPGIQRSVCIDALTPGEVNRLHSALVDVSGKGVNVCRVLQRLGVAALCLAQGGSNAGQLTALAEDERLDLRLIPAPGALRTCTSIIETAVAAGCRVTELVEPTAAVDAACVEALTAALQALLPTATALVIAGSMAPGFPAGYQASLARLARAAAIPVFLDIQGAPLREAIAAGPAVVKINLAEFVATFLADRFEGGEHSGVLAEAVLARELTDAVAAVSRQQATSFVLTRGANSIVLARDGEVRIVPLTPLAAREIVNPIGSGDAFLAGMVAQLLRAGNIPADQRVPLAALEHATGLATACAQSNARTARPGFLEDAFAV